MEYLNSQLAAFPQQQAAFQSLRDLFQEKLWHQVGIQLLLLTRDPFFQQEGRLIKLYDEFVKKFDNKLKPLDLVQLAFAAARQYREAEASIKFLESVEPVVLEDKEASLLLRLASIQVKLAANRMDECKTLIETSKTDLDSYPGVMDGLVYSNYYLAASEFYKARGTAAQFYDNSLLYLAYTPLQEIPVQHQIRLASDVGLAALVGQNVYNFGELLQHPIIKVLSGTEHEWLAQLLFAFNHGNIRQYQKIAEEKAASQDVLVRNAALLNQKIRIMALLELVFQRRPDDRTISFRDISQACMLPLDEVELLLIKALSSKVIRGSIDQVEQTARFKWVQPRVLDMKQVGTLRERIKGWAERSNAAADMLTDETPQLVRSHSQ